MESVSLIIPALDEAATLPGVMRSINRQSRIPKEILVVDGGSCDSTREAAFFGGARVLVASQAGRSQQMNEGAREASGSILLFLHADTLLPHRAVEQILATMQEPPVVGGGFCRRFIPGHPLLALTSRLADWRGRLDSTFHGDQAIFVRRSVFNRVGGFRQDPPFEDFDLCRRLKCIGKMVTLSPPVRSSARRFHERGVLSTVLSDFRLTREYFSRSSGE